MTRFHYTPDMQDTVTKASGAGEYYAESDYADAVAKYKAAHND